MQHPIKQEDPETARAVPQKWGSVGPGDFPAPQPPSPFLGDEAVSEPVGGHKIKELQGRDWVSEGMVGELDISVIATLGRCQLKLRVLKLCLETVVSHAPCP